MQKSLIKINKKNKKGIWFFGLSGSGKTFASKFIKKFIKNHFIIDGDRVRKYISFDLGYSRKNREMQIKRVYGMSKLSIQSKLFPIISTVYMNSTIAKKVKRDGIEIVKIERNMKKIFKTHKTYKNKKNVVSLDIKYPKINSKRIFNSQKKLFCSELKRLILKK